MFRHSWDQEAMGGVAKRRGLGPPNKLRRLVRHQTARTACSRRNCSRYTSGQGGGLGTEIGRKQIRRFGSCRTASPQGADGGVSARGRPDNIPMQPLNERSCAPDWLYALTVSAAGPFLAASSNARSRSIVNLLGPDSARPAWAGRIQ
jgi:hypothetical protein